MAADFALPLALDLAATGLFALSGALRAIRKGYDVAGLATIALVAGVGGGLLRDGIFLQGGPPVMVQDQRYLWAVGVGGAVGYWIGPALEERAGVLFLVVDALGLGAYAVVGAHKSLAAGLLLPSAVLVGVVNAVGGGVLRDVLSNVEPEVFKPGGYYALAAFAGASLFAVLATAGVPMLPAGVAGIVVTFALRVLSVRLGWTTQSVAWRQQARRTRPRRPSSRTPD